MFIHLLEAGLLVASLLVAMVYLLDKAVIASGMLGSAVEVRSKLKFNEWARKNHYQPQSRW